jgi:Cu-Zn family superoxide dismutase
VTAGNRYALVVGTASGVLARVDLKTRRVREIAHLALTAGDGMARTGHTLYVVNSASKVTQVKLSRDWLRGTIVRDITSPRLHSPTTVQIAGKRLLVVNSQLDNLGTTPDLPFTVSAIRRPGP